MVRVQGDFPNELQVYEDSQAAWKYLRNVRQILPEQIFIYGESLGGVIALDLAIRHPGAGANHTDHSGVTLNLHPELAN